MNQPDAEDDRPPRHAGVIVRDSTVRTACGQLLHPGRRDQVIVVPYLDPHRPLWQQDTLDSRAEPNGKLINCHPCRAWRTNALQVEKQKGGAPESRRLPARVRGPAAGP